MSNNWEQIIPSELHSEFSRQIDDAVSAQLMELFRNADELPGHPSVDHDELKAELHSSLVAKYIVLFQEGKWPTETCSQIGAKIADNTASHNWVCPSCRERNSNSFETCQKCSEMRPENAPRPTASTLVISAEKALLPTPLAVEPMTWSCSDCGEEFPTTTVECTKCLEPLDPYKSHSWPSAKVVPDPVKRQELRLRLFHAIRVKFAIDNPFTCEEISHEEFFEALDELKSRLLREIHPTPQQAEPDPSLVS
jgi:hypothetical protein